MKDKDSLPVTYGMDTDAVGIYSELQERCKATRSPSASIAPTQTPLYCSTHFELLMFILKDSISRLPTDGQPLVLLFLSSCH